MMSDNFGESVSPLAAIRAILHEYPFSASILRELLQNSTDAGAKKQIFVLDMGKDGKDAALMAYNDAQFHEEDWRAIQTIHQSSKLADTSKIGKYGVGFRACYHITDTPQILSGSSFATLDPIRSAGEMIDYNGFKEQDHRRNFDFFSDGFQSSSFPGTVIRLPLRSLPSELSERVVLVQELDKMIKDYIAEELSITLLFLGKLRTIEIWKVQDENKIHLATWTKSESSVEHWSKESSFSVSDVILSNGNDGFSWRIIQSRNAEDEARSRLATLVSGKTINHIFAKHKLSPDVRIAYPLFAETYTSGRLFTFLPLPSRTDFPVHIHSLFALTSSRQSLRNRNETGIVLGSDNDVLIKWNRVLFDYYIPQAWSYLLKTLAGDTIPGDIFSAWPPCCSSITSGDGLYWERILRATLHLAVQSSLAIWPKVSETDTITYVGLNSSLVIAKDQVNWDILIALARVGLTLVQVPQPHTEFLDDSITKLTPHVARDRVLLRNLLFEFNGLSQIQRRILCEYFLSDKDFNSIYGLPLFPALDESYISLDDRTTTTRRYIALSPDEVTIFGASAGSVIPLEQLQPAVAALVLGTGTAKANIDLLSPTSVVAYLSNEAKPRSEEDLSKFWSWLSEWCHREQAMKLFKASSSLRIIPTSKGPQLVSSPVFRALGDRLFEKLGVAYISSLLPSEVIYFLNRHGVIKDAHDVQELLTAIDPTALQRLTDDEAKSVFDHISTHYRSLSVLNLTKLKGLPIFPVLIPSTNMQLLVERNASVKCRTIAGLNVKGISPMALIPLTDDISFLDKSFFSNPSCTLLKTLQLPSLMNEDILLLALDRFSSQPKYLQASFVSFVRRNHRSTDSIISMLRKTQFIRTSDGTLQSPMEVIDPNSQLRSLFSAVSNGWLIPSVEDDYDRKILDDLRHLGMMKASLTSDIVQERASYISANRASAEALNIARSLLSLMNDPSFPCAGFSIDHSLHWLPTQAGQVISSKECINCGRSDTDLFDQVLTTLDETISTTASFRALLNWDKPLPLNVLTKQLACVLGQPSSDAQYRKVSEIIRELASRHPGDAEVKAIQGAIAERSWVPTKSGALVPASRAVFEGALNSGSFHEIGFSQAQKKIYRFLLKMGCHERPSVSAIVNELGALREKAGTDSTVIRQAIRLLELLPVSITEQERADLLVPTTQGDLVPLRNGVYYYRGDLDVGNGKIIVHRLIDEKLAKKIRIQYLGVGKAEYDIDLGGEPITLIRNTLMQYDPKQFFTEFIANASDAGAKRFSLLVDDHEGPTTHLLWEGLAAFQNASLIVHNDGVFTRDDTRDDFRGILETGIGGKRKRAGVIGHFGLGALSMFHFTELAMIVSGDRVLFISPSKHTRCCYPVATSHANWNPFYLAA